MLAYHFSWVDVYAFVDGFGLHFLLDFRLFGVCVFRLDNSVALFGCQTC